MTVKKNKSWMASSLMTAMLVGILTSVPARADVSEEVDNGHPDVSQSTGIVQTDGSRGAASRRTAGLDDALPATGLEEPCSQSRNP